MTFDVVMDALRSDPELAKKVADAKTPAERAAVIEAAGLPTPTRDSEFALMGDTAGGNGTTTDALVGLSAAGAC